MSDNPTHYKFDHEVMSMIWVALHESGLEDLAQVVSDTMITQGCQELAGVADGDATTLLACFGSGIVTPLPFAVFLTAGLLFTEDEVEVCVCISFSFLLLKLPTLW